MKKFIFLADVILRYLFMVLACLWLHSILLQFFLIPIIISRKNKTCKSGSSLLN